MGRLRTVQRCTECGSSTPRWTGRCPSCGAWNSLVEEVEEAAPAAAAHAGTARSRNGERPVLLSSVEGDGAGAVATGIEELDRVLAGGLVPGSVTLLAGEPGIGKSTLTLQAAGTVASTGAGCLLVSAEESRAQVRTRAERLGALSPTLWVVSETCLPDVLAAMAEVEPHLCVIDSVQMLFDPALESAPGSVAQVRHCAHRLVEAAKSSGTAVVLVGHVTKEGTVAGPRVLEHVVDTVLSFEGDRHHALRMLRAVKHRHGPTGELGLFEMRGDGLVGVSDPSSLLLADRRPGLAGSIVVPAMEGGRPLLVEVQALTVNVQGEAPARRSVQGLDAGRLPMLLAVLDTRLTLDPRLARRDVYTSVVGGIRVGEPAADLGVVLALLSACQNRAVDAGTVAFGEVGLGGEIRQVAHTPRRLAEAARLGFTRAVVPHSTADAPPGIELVRMATVGEAAGIVMRAAPVRPRVLTVVKP